MTARFLLNLLVALGIGGLVACTGDSTDKGDDDDDVVGDDDDDDVVDETAHTAVSDDGVSAADLSQMLIWAQYTVVGGEVQAVATDGANEFNTIFVLNVGPEEWDVNDANSTDFCQIIATMSAPSTGILDDAGTFLPYAEVGADAEVSTSCTEYVNDVTDPAFFTQLFTNLPGWAVGIPLVMSPEGRDELERVVTDPVEQEGFFGSTFNLALYKEPLFGGFYGVGAPVDATGAVVGSDGLTTADLTGTDLPDGVYYIDAFTIFPIDGLFAQ